MMRFKLSKICLVALSCVSLNAFAQTTELQTTAAIVNNDIILTSELDTATKEVTKTFLNRGHKIDAISARKAALEGLITDSLILQLAKVQGINLTDLQLDEILNQNARANNISVEQYLKSMAPNLSEAKAREEFRKNLILNEVKRSRVANRINISETEVALLAKNLKEVGAVEPRYHLSQIVVPLSTRPTIDQLQRAENSVNAIKSSLRQGVAFEELAARYSQGNMAARGGDLGFMPETQIPAPFLPSILKAKINDVVGPFRSPYGLHILKLLDVSYDAVTPIKEYDASHILLTTSIIFSDDAAYNQLNALRDKIISGDISFEVAATKVSEDPGSASKGGNLGYATPEKYDSRFAEAMVNLKVGEISKPIQSTFGWHLIKLNDIRVDTNSAEAYKNKARDLIYRRYFAQESIIWEQELRDSAFIKVQDPTLLNAKVNIDQINNDE